MSKPKKFDSLAQFEASLDSAQRSFFLKREAERDHRFQTLLRDLGRVVSQASTLAGEATGERVARTSHLTP